MPTSSPPPPGRDAGTPDLARVALPDLAPVAPPEGAAAALGAVLAALDIDGGRILLVGEDRGGQVASVVRRTGFEPITDLPPGHGDDASGAHPFVAIVAIDALASPRVDAPRVAAALAAGSRASGSVPVVLHGPVRTPLDAAAAAVGGGPLPGPPTWQLDAALTGAGFALVAGAELTRRAPAPRPAVDAGGSGSPPVALSERWSAGLAAAGTGEGVLGWASRAYRPPSTDAPPSPAPFLSVIVRTQGRRPGQLREALLCLAAQTDDDFELLVVLHTAGDDADTAAGARTLVAAAVDAHPTLAARTRLLNVVDGGRGRPLDVGLAHAQGRYVAFLDDDDLVMGDWVEAFRAGAVERPGAVVRSLTARQDVRAVTGPVGYEPTSAFTVPYRARFDLADHLIDNQSPICSVALPRDVLETFGLRVDETLPVLEDWDLLLRLVPWCGVHDTGIVTSLYHVWVDGTGSAGASGAPVWEATRRRILDRLANRVVLADPSVGADLIGAADELESVRQQLFLARAERDVAMARVVAVERSRWWQATLPLQRAVRLARRARALASRLAGTPTAH